MQKMSVSVSELTELRWVRRSRQSVSWFVSVAWRLLQSVESIFQSDIFSPLLSSLSTPAFFQMMMTALSKNTLSLLLKTPAVTSGTSRDLSSPLSVFHNSPTNTEPHLTSPCSHQKLPVSVRRGWEAAVDCERCAQHGSGRGACQRREGESSTWSCSDWRWWW